MRHLVLVAVILISIAGSSCSTNTEYIVQPVPLPEPLTAEQLPTERELECVTDEAYEKVVRMHKRIGTLEDLIKTTH